MTLKSLMGASFVVLALTLTGCDSGSADMSTKTATKAKMADATPILGSFGISLENMDESVVNLWGFHNSPR